MANSIAKAQKYVPILDAKYTSAAKTSILDSTEEAKYLAEANTFLVATRQLEGLAKYDRANGYKDGNVTVDWDPYVVDYDRGRMFNIDERDNEESAGMAYLGIAGQFIDEFVAPELDNVRLAAYCADAGVKATDGVISTGADAVKKLRTAITSMANNKVPVADRVTYMSNTLKGMIDDLDSYKSKAILDSLGTIITWEDEEFMDTCTLDDDGGFELSGNKLNFVIVSKKAVIQHLTHVAPKIVTPEMNQNADAYKFGYRIVGIVDVYENKKNGIYVSSQATAQGSNDVEGTTPEETTPEVTPEETQG